MRSKNSHLREAAGASTRPSIFVINKIYYQTFFSLMLNCILKRGGWKDVFVCPKGDIAKAILC